MHSRVIRANTVIYLGKVDRGTTQCSIIIGYNDKKVGNSNKLDRGRQKYLDKSNILNNMTLFQPIRSCREAARHANVETCSLYSTYSISTLRYVDRSYVQTFA